jgi:drug/metabolite transporter (DMT)-like permease
MAHLVLLLGLGSAFCFGVADFLGARASKHLGPITSALCVQIVGTALFSAWFLLFGHTSFHLELSVFMYTLAGAALLSVALCALYAAFEIGPVSLASPLSAAYPLVAAVMGVVFFHAHLSWRQIGGLLILVFGVMAVSGLFKVTRSERRLSKGVLLALTATVLWGIGYPLLNHAIVASSWQAVSFWEYILMVPMLGVLLWWRRGVERPSVRQIGRAFRDPFINGAGAMQMLAGLAINLGFMHDKAAGAIIVALSSTYPLLTMALAFKHFKEQLEKWLLVGAGATVLGVILLSY